MDAAGLPALIEAIAHLHGATATWAESVPVRETFRGEVAWEGEVQVFDLAGHPTATRAYAWSHATEGGAAPASSPTGAGELPTHVARNAVSCFRDSSRELPRRRLGPPAL
jgi:hypothetical protein